MLKNFVFRWLFNFMGLLVAASLFTGISYGEHVRVLVWAALIFSLVNAAIRPLIVLLSLPVIVLTMGLFTFVINALMLYLVTFFYDKFQLRSFWTALGAVIIIWLVNYLLNEILVPRRNEKSV